MPRLRIIVLDQTVDDPNTYNFVFWADVPVARQSRYADPNKKSAWPDALPADLAALQNGSVAELLSSKRVPAGTPLPQIETHLQAQWTDYQNSITNGNPWSRYGSTWDGTTWTVVNNG